MKEYKVLTRKDKFFTAGYSPEAYENALNAYAKEGWEVVSVTGGDFAEGIPKDIVTIFERDIDEDRKPKMEMSESRLYDNLIGM
ncbi:MAG: DUF4177 domain-containing protein [Clostridiaceae bacterium]